MLGVKFGSLATPKLSINHSDRTKRRFFPHPVTALQKQNMMQGSDFDKKKHSAASSRKLSLAEQTDQNPV